MGCLLVAIRHDLSAMFAHRAEEADETEMDRTFAELEAEATERLRREGVAPEHTVLQRTASMRYLGQWRSLTVTIGAGPGALADVVAQFHEQHEREFAYRRDDTPVEIYQLGLRAIGATPKPAFAAHAAEPVEAPEPTSRRKVWFEDGGWLDTAIHDRSALSAGTRLRGPAVIDQLDSTTVIPPGARAEIDEWLNIRIHVTEGPDEQH